MRGNAGQTNPAARALTADDTAVARMLQEAVYRTAMTGKAGVSSVNSVTCQSKIAEITASHPWYKNKKREREGRRLSHFSRASPSWKRVRNRTESGRRC